MQDSEQADIRFGRQILAFCLFAIAVLVINMTVLGGQWVFIACIWLALGYISVMIQVLTHFGYIRVVPRFDALVPYSISVVAGPFSLGRVLLNQVRKTQRIA